MSISSNWIQFDVVLKTNADVLLLNYDSSNFMVLYTILDATSDKLTGCSEKEAFR